MAGSQHTTIAILGAGKGGSALLDLLTHIPGVPVIGVADKDPSAPGIQRALQHGVHVASNVMDLIRQDGIDLITAENLVEEKDPAAVRQQAQEILGAVQRISFLTKELTHYTRHSAALGSRMWSSRRNTWARSSSRSSPPSRREKARASACIMCELSS